MTLSVALLTLAHILVFVYWLGGDLGAFVSSYTLIDGRKPVAARLMALNVVNNVDMAPRTALILAFPTGLSLAEVKGWMDVPTGAVAVVWLVAVIWLGIAWRIHLKHSAPQSIERRSDMVLRISAALGLFGFSAGVFLDVLPTIPWFIGLKCLLLGFAITAGLVVRRALKPLFVAARGMAAEGPTPERDRVLRHVILWRSKPTVVSIWILITLATLAGIMTPV